MSNGDLTGKNAEGPARSHFIRDIILENHKTNKYGRGVHTRFPPEPNGYLHIGHAKSICLNFGLAAEFGGNCNLRFDDTNPCKEEVEYVESILRDVRWLGFNWEDRLFYASDYFEKMYEYAEALIKKGKAFVCDLDAKQMAEHRGGWDKPGQAGTAHAEVIAIEKAGNDTSGSTLYVSLEPCCHKDKRTPPCTQKIIAAKIKRVVVAMKDPNPRVSGKGIEELRKAGIEVVSGIQEEKARQLNECYIKYITTSRPFVVLKVAMTLDGKIATPDGESKWITGEKARKEVHRLRGKVDAIMTAIGTIKADDPLLTCRAGNRRSPIRIILDPDLEIKSNANALTGPPRTILVTSETASKKKQEQLPTTAGQNNSQLL